MAPTLIVDAISTPRLRSQDPPDEFRCRPWSLALTPKENALAAADRSSALKAMREGDTVVVVVGGSIAAADVAVLCEAVSALMAGAGDAVLVVCDLGRLPRIDLETLDALARLRLTVRRQGCDMRLRSAGVEVREMIALVGLSDLLNG